MLGSFMDGNGIDWVYSLALLVLGFALILLELFVIPGLNIFGFIGFLATVAGVGFAYAKMGFDYLDRITEAVNIARAA